MLAMLCPITTATVLAAGAQHEAHAVGERDVQDRGEQLRGEHEPEHVQHVAPSSA